MARRLTPHERYVQKKYTRVKGTTLFLSIDHQEFTIEGENVKFFQRNLAIALARMIETELAVVLEPVVAEQGKEPK
ncbi:MAG: hypothetical protein ACYDHW_06625 [Syntrophorhabdaceae bacterium]